MRTTSSTFIRTLPVLILIFAVGACGAESSPTADSGSRDTGGFDSRADVGTTNGDSGALDGAIDAAIDAATDALSDARTGSDATALLDTGLDITTTDASQDAVIVGSLDTLLVLAYGGTTCTGGISCVQGFTYRAGGSWSRSAIGENGYAQSGGGLVTAGGRGRALYRPFGGDSFARVSEWDSVTGWSANTPLDNAVVNSISLPVASATHVMFAVASPTNSIAFYAYGLGGASSVLGETTLLGDSNSTPVLAALGGSDVLLMTASYTRASPQYEYIYKVRRNGVWSSAASITSVSFDRDAPTSPALASLPNNRALALVSTGTFSAPQLQSLVYANGLWSAPVVVATDAYLIGSDYERHFAMLTLADGRVAVAYRTTNNAVKVGYYGPDGWSNFAAVPNVTVANGVSPSLARGISGATLELVYLDNQSHIQHTRLVGATWSTPLLVSDVGTYGFVSAASL